MRNTLILVLVCLFSICSFGQLDDQTGFYTDELANAIQAPVSPEAAAFMKYGDVSVNMYTGTPSISIPIYSHRGIETSLPISLNYDAQGVKVQEMASLMGLKFNLVAGGRISRISNGEPDDFFQSTGARTFFTDSAFRNTYLDLFLNTTSFNSVNDVFLYLNNLETLSKPGNDMFPDYYSINAPNMNGYATFNVETMQMQCIDNPRTQVSYQTSGNGNVIESITITGEDGTVCVFGGIGAQEITETINFNDTGAGSGAGSKRFITSWLLTRIESPNKKDIYEFDYFAPVIWDDSFRADPTTHVVNSYRQDPSNLYNTILGNNEESRYGEEHKIEQLFLQRIRHNGRMIIENEMTSRLDVPTTDLGALDSIKIYDWCEGEDATGSCAQEILRTIDFDYSYFNVDASIGETPESKPYDEIRLKLDAVNFIGKDNKRYQQYRMEYENPEDLPGRLNLGQDYLGFYNGKGNSVLYPELTTARGDFLAGADRSVGETFITTGMLKRLYYPTGGFSEFEFEPHRLPNGTTTVTESEGVSVSGSGTTETNCGACCNDKFLPEGGAVVNSRVVSLSGTYQLTFDRVGTAECYIRSILSASAALEYSDICGTSSAGFTLHNSAGTPLNQSIVLLPGTYQLMTVVSATPGNSASLNLTQDTEVPIFTLKAGVRVKQVTDFTKENEVARTKNYNYLKEDGVSSGVLVNDPVLSYVTNTPVDNPQSGVVDNLTSIHRLSTATGGGEPHVAYTRVEEVISDSGKTVMTYNVGPTGIMSGSAPSGLNYYQTNLENANPNTTQVYTIDNELLSESTTEYSGGGPPTVAGFEVVNRPGRTHKYVLVSDQGNGTFAYSFVRPEWACVGSGCTPFPRQPAVCNLPNNTCFERRLAVFDPGISSARGLVGGSSKVIATQYPDPSNPSESIVTTTETTYDAAVDFLPRESKVTDSEGNEQVNVNFYPKDLKDPSHQRLIDNNKLVTGVQSEQFEIREGVLHKTTTRQMTYTTAGTTNLADVPLSVYTAKEDDPLELRLTYTAYDPIGNLAEIEQERGIPTAVLWGYDESRIIAKVENAEFRKLGAEVTSTGAQAITQALFEFIPYAELQNLTGTALRTVLDQALRNNPLFSGMVTTYTHKPQVGITTMTDTRGYTIFYEYDEFLRLKAVRDADGHLLNTNEYRYQTEQ